ncbi:MAG TPA: hypothetical protein VK156_01640 [Candidatus Limnocylindria bacterium]|nr:hypothetical protein [Candidatus Limnocylindria bacterium]
MRRSSLICVLVVVALVLPGCKRLRGPDTQPLDQAGIWYEKVQELKGLEVSESEVAEIVRLKQAGVSDATCVDLVSQARVQKRPFADADAVLDLFKAGVAEPTILQLGQMKQLPGWAGEAVAIRLTGLSDKVLLAVARRRAAGQTVLSGPVIAKLKNVELTEAQILDHVNRGTTDAQAEQIVAAKRRAAGSTGFVRIHGRKPH